MPTDDTHPISAEAHERVTRERDDLKAKLAETQGFLDDVRLRDRMYEHFRQDPQLHDPYGLASAAVRDVTLKGAGPEELPQKLTDWLGEQRRLIAAPATPTDEKPPPSPFQGPNPGAPGFQAKPEPMLVGSPEWNLWAKGKDAAEQIAALRRGDAVSPEQVKQAQRIGTFGAP